jgi:serine/threonine protein kinase
VHERGIVHRDVKPPNILLAPHPWEEGPWTAKLTDFGIARVSDATSLTMTRLTIGTASYLSPEQALGQPIHPPSDIYSLGLVLLEALTGVRAFVGATLEVAIARIDHPPQVPTQLGPDWMRLLTAMTGQDPNARPSAIQVAHALQDIRAGQTSPMVIGPLDVILGGGSTDADRDLPSPSNPEPLIPANKPVRRMRWIVLTGISAAVVAVSALAVGAASRSHRPPSAPTPSVRMQAPRPLATANPATPADSGRRSRTAAPTPSAARPQPPRTSSATHARGPTAARSPSATQGKQPSATATATQTGPSTATAASTPPAGPTPSASASPTASPAAPPTSTPDAGPSPDPSETPPVPPTSRR